MKYRPFALVAAIALVLGASDAASAQTPRWCGSQDLNASERIICTDGILSRLDVELDEAYDRARRVDPDLEQRAWLRRRNECGMNLSCLETAYRTRTAELQTIASAAEAPSDRAQRSAPDRRAITVTPLPRAGVASPPPDGVSTGSDRSQVGDLIARLEALLREIDPVENDQSEAARGMDDPPPAPRLGPRLRRTLAEMTPRPWCDAQRLNPTERTICANDRLSRLDALLALAYGRSSARDEDRLQSDWLRSERDICGTNIRCIGKAYRSRIEELDFLPPERGQEIVIPYGHFPPPGSCRVWYPERPPGQQPPPTSCDVHLPSGAVLIRG